MPYHLRKFLTAALLATYASVAILGHGLHWLTPDDEHHHHHEAVCEAHDHGHDHDSCECEAGQPQQSVAASHDCEICEFLLHAISEQPQVLGPPEFHVLVAELPREIAPSYAATILGLHAARGPPAMIG